MLEDVLSAAFDIIGDLAGDVFLSLLFERKLSNKRINSEIDELKNEGWFKVLYEDPNYKKYFMTNETIRHFIGHKRAKRIRRRAKYQHQLKELLREAYLFDPSIKKRLLD